MGRSGNALVMLLPHEEPYVDFLRLRKVISLSAVSLPSFLPSSLPSSSSTSSAAAAAAAASSSSFTFSSSFSSSSSSSSSSYGVGAAAMLILPLGVSNVSMRLS